MRTDGHNDEANGRFFNTFQTLLKEKTVVQKQAGHVCVSVCPLFVHIEQHDSQWIDFREISYFEFVDIPVRLKSDSNDIPHTENYIPCIYGIISP